MTVFGNKNSHGLVQRLVFLGVEFVVEIHHHPVSGQYVKLLSHLLVVFSEDFIVKVFVFS